MNTRRYLEHLRRSFVESLRRSLPVARLLLPLAVLPFAACGSDDVVGVRANGVSTTITVHRGQKVDFQLGNVGPAIWESPPSISSSVLEYLGVEIVPPYDPGGPTQLFHFTAVAPGEAIVTFQRVLGDSVVATLHDTVVVR